MCSDTTVYDGFNGSVLKRPLPYAEEDGPFARGSALRLLLETHDVGQSGDGGGHVPRQTQEGADEDSDSHHEHVQVVAVPFLKPGTSGTTEVANMVIFFCGKLQRCFTGLQLVTASSTLLRGN